MNIGERLYELRQAKGFSQGDIEHRTGLLRCYLSRVENGHTIPNLETLEKLAKALDLQLYQLFFSGDNKPKAPPTARVASRRRRRSQEEALLAAFNAMPRPTRTLLVAVAQKMAAAEKGK